LLRHLGRLLEPAGLAALTDRQLLERFTADRDEAAFAALVRRHGGLVFGVCRRLLGDAHDAEDAFQATFLVLAKKAGSIRQREYVAGWLHGVATRLARKARAQRVRRHFPEAPGPVPAPDVASAVAGAEACRLLDEELGRLPAHYRLPLVLCYLEGKSRREAALALGCSEGAVKGKLERGRELLRARLVRRGVALVPAGLAASLDGQAGAAAPAAWLAAAVRAASGEGGTVSALAAALAAGLLRTRSRTLAATLLLVGLATAAAVPLVRQARETVPGAENHPGALAVADTDRLPLRAPVLFVGFAQRGKTPPARPGWTAYCATCHAESSPPAAGSLGPELCSPDRVCAALAPDGFLLAAAGTDGRVRLWDLTAGRSWRRLEIRAPGEVSVLAFTPDGRHLAACDATAGVRLWDVATGREVCRLGADRAAGGCAGRGDAIVFSPDGGLLATGSTVATDDTTTGVIRLWDVRGGEEIRQIRGRAPDSSALAFTPDGRLLAWPAADGTVRLEETVTGEELRRLALPEARAPADLTFAPDGKVLAAWSRDGAVRLWDVAAGREVRRLAGPAAAAAGLAFSPDGRFLAVADAVGGARLWDVATGRECFAGRPTDRAGLGMAVDVASSHGGGERPSSVSPNGRLLAGWRPGGVCVWDAVAGRRLCRLETDRPVTAPPVFAPDGRRLATGHDDGSASVWDLAAGDRQLRLGTAQARPLTRIGYAPDGKVLAGADGRRAVHFWDARTGQELDQQPGASLDLISVALAADGRSLAREATATTPLVWDVVGFRPE
jgi:RNA polymerase sigma factor (sigma-70 family)